MQSHSEAPIVCASRYSHCVVLTVTVLMALVLIIATPRAVQAARGPASDPTAAAQVDGPEKPGAESAEAAVERLHEALLAAMKIPGVDGFASRVEAIEPAVLGVFDFTTIGGLVLGAHWKAMNQADRERFLVVFRRYVVANYAAEFDSFAGHTFHTDASAEQQPHVVVVRARLVTGAGDTHRFDYQTKEKDGRWFIVNVAVDGVSDVALKRAQYDAVIRKDGFDALLGTLEDKIAGFARGEKDDD